MRHLTSIATKSRYFCVFYRLRTICKFERKSFSIQVRSRSFFAPEKDIFILCPSSFCPPCLRDTYPCDAVFAMVKQILVELKDEAHPMISPTNPLKTEIVYPDTDGKPMAESDPTRDYLIYGVEALGTYFQDRNDVYVSGNLFIYYKRGVPDAVVAPDVFVVFGVERKKRMSYKAWEEGGHLPSFVLEVTSKSTQENDESDKFQKYQRMGVLEYFQYDPTGDYLQPPLKGSRLIHQVYQPIAPVLLTDGTVSLHSQALGLDLRLVGSELRFYQPQTGRKLLSPQETEQARQQAEQALQGAVPRLLKMGLSLEQVAEALGLSVEQVQQAVDAIGN